MERYRLFWTQSTATSANTQDVVARINSGSEAVIGSDLLMSTAEFFSNFVTGAVVEWWVRTYDETKSAFQDSPHDTFVSTNEEPLAGATNLGHAWVSHVA